MVIFATLTSGTRVVAHDLAAIARVWMDNGHVVSSTSAQSTGRGTKEARGPRPDWHVDRAPAMGTRVSQPLRDEMEQVAEVQANRSHLVVHVGNSCEGL
jgi:hypothetical protein